MTNIVLLLSVLFHVTCGSIKSKTAVDEDIWLGYGLLKFFSLPEFLVGVFFSQFTARRKSSSVL